MDLHSEKYFVTLPTNQHGYSLIESAVSIALLITVLLPLVHYASVQLYQKRAQNEIQALQLAQKAIEEAIASPELLAANRREGPWIIYTRYRPQTGGLSVNVRIQRNERFYAELTALKPLETLDNPVNLSS